MQRGVVGFHASVPRPGGSGVSHWLEEDGPESCADVFTGSTIAEIHGIGTPIALVGSVVSQRHDGLTSMVSGMVLENRRERVTCT